MITNPCCPESDWLKRTVRFGCFVWAAFLLSCFTAVAQADSGVGDDKYLENVTPAPRQALVIGASNYVNVETLATLPSASLDGKNVSEKLENLGFTVTNHLMIQLLKYGEIKDFESTPEGGSRSRLPLRARLSM